jgi:hypothetical protein
MKIGDKVKTRSTHDYMEGDVVAVEDDFVCIKLNKSFYLDWNSLFITDYITFDKNFLIYQVPLRPYRKKIRKTETKAEEIVHDFCRTNDWGVLIENIGWRLTHYAVNKYSKKPLHLFQDKLVKELKKVVVSRKCDGCVDRYSCFTEADYKHKYEI